MVSNTYDNTNRVVTAQRDAKAGQTAFVYDAVNRTTVFTDALGNATKHYHDELHRLIQEDNANGDSSRYAYDAAGNRISVSDKISSGR